MLLYAHIPFCESKCPYCAFGSVVGKSELYSQYFKALIDDFKAQVQNFNVEKNSISTLFIGGGTPSAVDALFYEDFFAQISPFLKDDCEITSEANPNSATYNWLKSMRSYGVNRISFGAQSFFEDKLKFLGRLHDKKQVFTAVQNAKKAGFKNINVDIIYSTKFDTKKRLSQEVLNLKELGLTHVSAYSLTLEPKTPFFGKTSYKKDSPILAKFLINELENIGLKQYEISNFGQICRHNLGYWQGKNYLAIGAYAIGYVDNQRFYNQSNLNDYIDNPYKKDIENLSPNDKKLERIFLGARSIVGIGAEILNESQLKKAEILTKAKKLVFKDDKFYVKNYLLADEIALFIAG
ncbi:radical SAM family heme chaperone HemW [Campylobacter mucosalis]|uniref:radical SAM family heme chaperone HemW n=1 Tax=Campylobacter mucosalis TaxID=202 RepID=UPI0014702A99